jgi:hypothetical protein
MKPGTTEQHKGVSGIDTGAMIEIQEGVMQVAMGVMIVAAALVGIWGFISLFGGIQSGGLLELGRDWLNAVNG